MEPQSSKIDTREDYEIAVDRLSSMMDDNTIESGSREELTLLALANDIAAYEAAHIEPLRS